MFIKEEDFLFQFCNRSYSCLQERKRDWRESLESWREKGRRSTPSSQNTTSRDSFLFLSHSSFQYFSWWTHKTHTDKRENKNKVTQETKQHTGKLREREWTRSVKLNVVRQSYTSTAQEQEKTQEVYFSTRYSAKNKRWEDTMQI